MTLPFLAKKKHHDHKNRSHLWWQSSRDLQKEQFPFPWRWTWMQKSRHIKCNRIQSELKRMQHWDPCRIISQKTFIIQDCFSLFCSLYADKAQIHLTCAPVRVYMPSKCLTGALNLRCNIIGPFGESFRVESRSMKIKNWCFSWGKKKQRRESSSEVWMHLVRTFCSACQV